MAGDDSAQLQQIQAQVGAQPMPSYTPPWMRGIQDSMIPAGAPGQIDALARDLAAGGFGNPAANQAWMNTFYAPARSYKTGAAPKKTGTNNNTAPTDTNGRPTDFGTGSFRQENGKWVEVRSRYPYGRNMR